MHSHITDTNFSSKQGCQWGKIW